MPKKLVLAECALEWVKDITCSEVNSNLKNYVEKSFKQKESKNASTK